MQIKATRTTENEKKTVKLKTAEKFSVNRERKILILIVLIAVLQFIKIVLEQKK